MYDIEISRSGILGLIGPHYFIPVWNLRLIYACILHLTRSAQLACDLCGWSETAIPGDRYKGNKIIARITRR